MGYVPPKPPAQKKNKFARSPANKIALWLRHDGRTFREFGEDMGFDIDQISRLLNGRMTISHSTAGRLARVTGIPAAEWLRIQREYDERES